MSILFATSAALIQLSSHFSRRLSWSSQWGKEDFLLMRWRKTIILASNLTALEQRSATYSRRSSDQSNLVAKSRLGHVVGVHNCPKWRWSDFDQSTSTERCHTVVGCSLWFSISRVFVLFQGHCQSDRNRTKYSRLRPSLSPGRLDEQFENTEINHQELQPNGLVRRKIDRTCFFRRHSTLPRSI